MKLTCEICNGTIVKKDNGMYCCAECGVCYTEANLKEKLTKVNADISAPQNVDNLEKVTLPESNKLKDERHSRIKKLLIIVAPIVVVLLFVALSYISSANNDKDYAKQMTEDEVIDTWKSVDDSIELVSIRFDDVEKTIAGEAQIDKILDDRPNVPHTVDGTKYSSIYEYWDHIGYDPYSDTWEIYKVTGRYRISCNNEFLTGSFCVRVLQQKKLNTWSIWKTEIEVPEEFRQYAE